MRQNELSLRGLIAWTLGAAIVTAILYWVCYVWFSIPLAYWFHQLSPHSLLYQLAAGVSFLMGFDFWAVVAVLGFVIFAVGYAFKRTLIWRRGLLFTMSLLAALFVAGVFKIVLARYRPELLFTKGLYGFHFFSMNYWYNSTPSGHTARAFAIAVCCGLFWRRWRTLFIVLAVLVGLSRLILDMHYAGDALFGLFIGVFAPLWVRAIFFRSAQL